MNRGLVCAVGPGIRGRGIREGRLTKAFPSFSASWSLPGRAAARVGEAADQPITFQGIAEPRLCPAFGDARADCALRIGLALSVEQRELTSRLAETSRQPFPLPGGRARLCLPARGLFSREHDNVPAGILDLSHDARLPTRRLTQLALRRESGVGSRGRERIP